LPAGGCLYELYDTPDAVLNLLANRWTVTTGGSNNLIMTHELLKLIEPGIAGTFVDAEALRTLGVPEPLLSHVYRGQRVGSARVFDFVWAQDSSSGGFAYNSHHSSWRLVHLYSAAYSDFDPALGCAGADGALEWLDGIANCLNAMFNTAPDFVPNVKMVRITHVEGRFADYQTRLVESVLRPACALPLPAPHPSAPPQRPAPPCLT